MVEEMTQEVKPKTRKKHRPLTTAGKLSGWWLKFFEKTREFDSLQVGKWKTHHIVGYICKRFLDTYNAPYSFSLTGAPMTCQEMYMINKITYILNNDNPRYIKDYIDWVFDKKLISQNKKLTSFAFFANASLANEFQIYHANATKIRRSTNLPNNYLELAQRYDLEISTYGDLAFIKMAIDNSEDLNDLSIYRNFFNDLLALSFDKNVLNDLEE